MTLRHYLPLLAATLAVVPLFVRAAIAEPEPKISAPVTHDNVAVYFLRGASAPGPVPDTLQEALAKGTVEVHETGNVQELKIRNTGDRPVFVQLGDIVKGGQQDRVLTISIVLEPKSGLVPIGAFCVEQGRWSARGTEDVRRFAGSADLMPSREAKIALAKPLAGKPEPPRAALGAANVLPPAAGQALEPIAGARQATRELMEQRRTRSVTREFDSQGEIWRSVGLVQQQLAATLSAPVASEKSRTSLQLSLENEKLLQARAAYLATLEPAGLKDDDILGVVVAVNGRIASADVYPSNGLFRKMWPKLARAAATEALTKSKEKADTAPAAEAVAAFLKAAAAGEKSEREIAGLTRIEARSTDKALNIETRNLRGEILHKSFIAY